ncbi:MAG: STAS domain-containing protein [Solirubrobacteraceae bacterium]
MPLYACEHCGFTSAAFRNDAAAAHRLASPDCDGPIRIIFRSEDRYRGSTYAHATAPVAAQGTHERHAATNQPRRAFAIREHPDLDGMLRLTLLGDLDLTTADTFRSRLAELKPSGRPVRLDLSQLAFIDSSGIQALLAVLTDARWTGWQLDVAQQISPTVARAADGGRGKLPVGGHRNAPLVASVSPYGWPRFLPTVLS